MCLAVPAKVVELRGFVAEVDIGGNRREASVALLDNVEVGDYVLVHAGFAISKYEQEEAMETLKLWDEVLQLAGAEGESTPSGNGRQGPRKLREPLS